MIRYGWSLCVRRSAIGSSLPILMTEWRGPLRGATSFNLRGSSARSFPTRSRSACAGCSSTPSTGLARGVRRRGR
eukprot:7595529-Pyramimonas_sp.AAC.1